MPDAGQHVALPPTLARREIEQMLGSPSTRNRI
jgi:hypothetical protein